MTITATDNNELFENQRRATVVGPVLDEILHASWNHWAWITSETFCAVFRSDSRRNAGSPLMARG